MTSTITVTLGGGSAIPSIERDGVNLSGSKLEMRHRIDPQMAGIWVDGERCYDTLLVYVWDDVTVPAVSIPPRSRDVEFVYDELERQAPLE